MTNRPEPFSTGAFTRAWVGVQPTVTAYLYSLIRNVHDADDVLQEVAAAALADIAAYDPARPFLPWVLGIARRRAMHHFRQLSSDKLVFSDAALELLEHAHAGLHESTSQRRLALQHCLQRVSQRGRRVLQLRYAEDRSVIDVAQELGATVNAISLLLHKVRRQLADCIERRVRLTEATQ